MIKFSENTMAAIVWDVITLTIGALAADTSVNANSKIDGSRIQGFRVLRTEYYAALKGSTSGEGPILLYLNHDLTVAEADATFAADPQRPKDPTASEAANRPVWPLEIFFNTAAGNGNVVLKGVKKLGWSFQEGTILKWSARNMSTSTLTTGSTVRIFAKHFGVWLRD